MTKTFVLEGGVRPYRQFFQYFRNAADSNDLTVDGSGTPATFKITCPNTGTLDVHRITMVIVDGGIGYGEFGGLGSVLTNGILIKVHDASDNVLLDYLDGEAIKANEDWGILAGADAVTIPAAGDDSLPIRWTIRNSGAATQLTPGEYIQVTIRDDLSNVTKFNMMAQGIAR